MARICVLCYKYTHRNLPFCYRHYKEFQEVIDPAIDNKEEWLRELERITQKEHRRRKKIRQEMSLVVIGEENYE